MNLYAYVGNDPINKTDPTGLAGSGCYTMTTGIGYVCAGEGLLFGSSDQRENLQTPNTTSTATPSTPSENQQGSNEEQTANNQSPANMQPVYGVAPNPRLVALALIAGSKELSKQAQRGIQSLTKQIMAHEKKLADFKANPTVRPGMEGQPQKVIEAAQQSRIQHLEKEIDTFLNNIEKYLE